MIIHTHNCHFGTRLEMTSEVMSLSATKRTYHMLFASRQQIRVKNAQPTWAPCRHLTAKVFWGRDAAPDSTPASRSCDCCTPNPSRRQSPENTVSARGETSPSVLKRARFRKDSAFAIDTVCVALCSGFVSGPKDRRCRRAGTAGGARPGACLRGTPDVAFPSCGVVCLQELAGEVRVAFGIWNKRSDFKFFHFNSITTHKTKLNDGHQKP